MVSLVTNRDDIDIGLVPNFDLLVILLIHNLNEQCKTSISNCTKIYPFDIGFVSLFLVELTKEKRLISKLSVKT